MSISGYNDNVFINCPFDDEYKELFNSIIFCIFDCGFIARCTKEEPEGIRLDRIYNIISECKYGIHDLSRTELDHSTNLPRFNMPFELGVFLATKNFGNEKQQDKKCLILDKELYRYQKFISDILGLDPKAHEDNPSKAILKVRDWLRDTSNRNTIPSGSVIGEHYVAFKDKLPLTCSALNLKPKELSFNDYIYVVSVYLKNQNKKREE